MKEPERTPAETEEPSTDPTPAGDVPALRDLAEREGGTVEPDEEVTAAVPVDQED